MIIPDYAIQHLAEHFEVRAMAQALEVPATDIAKDLLQPLSGQPLFEIVRSAGTRTVRNGHVSAFMVMWQCQSRPRTHAGFVYLRVGLSLN